MRPLGRRARGGAPMKRRRPMFPRHPHGAPPPSGRDLDPRDVLIDLFEGGDLPLTDPTAAADAVIQRLIDAGFEIRPAT